MRINVKFVFIEEFIKDHSSRWKSVKTVVLIIFISELVDTDNFSTKRLVLLFKVPAPPPGSFSSNIKNKRFKFIKEYVADTFHLYKCEQINECEAKK